MLRETICYLSPLIEYFTISLVLQIKERSKIIFGTADKMRCNILTSNEAFIRAATAQGVTVSAIIYQSRALSELKRLEESQTDK